jgi:hypothetical protein
VIAHLELTRFQAVSGTSAANPVCKSSRIPTAGLAIKLFHLLWGRCKYTLIAPENFNPKSGIAAVNYPKRETNWDYSFSPQASF